MTSSEYEDTPIIDRLNDWLTETWDCTCDSDVGFRCYNCCRYQDIRDAIKTIEALEKRLSRYEEDINRKVDTGK